ncbi:MAG TPA: Uma2 family endonuclease [Gemmataceae bacterium]|jgi:Uma2 family endonuclease
MATQQTAPPAVPRTRGSVVLPNTDWKTYRRLLKAFADQPGVRLTYDRGDLEIMSPSFVHDSSGRFLGRLVVTLTEELGLQILPGGSTTLRRRLRRRGIEPDECFWIQNEAAVRGVPRLNLRVHPPPDLAIEVDVTNSSLDRMGIYAALGIPEVWRLDGARLTFQELGADGRYAERPTSRAFLRITPADLVRFLNQRRRDGDNETVRQVRAWVRQLPPPTP